MSSWITETIAPKSDQLNAEDMLTGPIVVEVTKVERGSAEQPAIIHVKGRQPFKPCKTMRRALVACWGDDVDSWVGRSMKLYCDNSVKWAGEEVGGIRIEALSHIDATKSMKLSVSKGKRKTVTIQPLKVTGGKSPAKKQDEPKQPETPAVIAKHQAMFKGAPADVIEICKSIKELHATVDPAKADAIKAEIGLSAEESWRSKLTDFLRDVLDELKEKKD